MERTLYPLHVAVPGCLTPMPPPRACVDGAPRLDPANGHTCPLLGYWRMPWESAPDLRLADDLADVHADEDRGCFWHLAQRVEGRFGGPGVFLGIEQPEGMLD